MSDYKKESQILQVLDFFNRNPGSALSIAYMLLTLCGIYYSFSFFAQFDIPILKLADISDILIAGIGEPAALLMFSGGILIAALSDFISQRSYDAQKRWRQKPPSAMRSLMLVVVYTPKRSQTVMLFTVGMFALYSFLFVFWYADWQGEQVKAGHGHKILLSGESVTTVEPMILLGSTTNYVVAYDVKAQQAGIYPVETLTLIKPISGTSTDEQDVIEENESSQQ